MRHLLRNTLWRLWIIWNHFKYFVAKMCLILTALARLWRILKREYATKIQYAKSAPCFQTRLYTSNHGVNMFIKLLNVFWVTDTWPKHPFQGDVIKWKHLARYWPFVRGIHRSPVNSPHTGQWRGALMFSLIYAWRNSWVHNREAGDLRRHRAQLWRHCNISGILDVSLHYPNSTQEVEEFLQEVRNLSASPPFNVDLKPNETVSDLKSDETLTHPWITWLVFRRLHFQMHFHEWKYVYFD